MDPSPPRVLAWAVGAVLVAAASEWATWRASHQQLPPGRASTRVLDDEVVLVLGFPSGRSGRASAVQRWRVRIAARSTDPSRARFVFTGGPPEPGAASEASVMAVYSVRALGLPADRIRLEERSPTTWENIAFAVPLLRDAPRIRIASNTFHARRARHYLRMQAPELARRLARGRDYVPGELLPLKPLLVLVEWRRLRRSAAQTSG